MLTRRSFLVAGASSLVAPGAAAAQGPSGTTLRMRLESAPFASSGYRDSTVIAYVPDHYRPEPGSPIDVVVHFHGMRYTAERAMRGHVLREQLDDSEQRAVLIVPQLAVMALDSSAGSLEREGGLARLLREALDGVRAAIPILSGTRGPGRVCLSAHSGGYGAMAHCLRLGGIEIQECWLFDALYGSLDVFRDWTARSGVRHKLVSFHAGEDTTRNSIALAASLRAGGIDCREERAGHSLSRRDLLEGQAVFIPVPNGHSDAVFAQNELRDCLRASILKQRGSGDWFRDVDGPRRIDRRGGG